MLLKSPVCAQESPPCDLSVCTHLCLQIREAGSLILYIHRNCASAAVLLLFGAAVYGSEVHGLHILFVPLPCQKGKTSVPLPVTVAKTFHPVRCWEFVPQLHRGPRIIWGTSAACAAACGRSKLTFALARTIHNLTFVYRTTVWRNCGCCWILCDRNNISEHWRRVWPDTSSFMHVGLCQNEQIYTYMCTAWLISQLSWFYITVQSVKTLDSMTECSCKDRASTLWKQLKT